MNKLLVEFFGTLVFLFVILKVGQPLVIGLTLTAVVMLGGNISGGHFNPAVSVMMAFAKKLPMNDLVPYVIAQVLGGLAALQLYKRV